MKMIKLMISGLLLFGLIYFGNQQVTLRGNSLPPIGKFFNPQGGFWANARAAMDESTLSADLNLNSEVTVKYDDRLVPHIFADNDHDLYFTQGYITAKHRLWQMDLTARSTAGRLSEVLGKRTLEVDKESRQLGLPLAAENAAKSWTETANGENQSLIDYIEGVNAYISTLEPKDYPLEFKLLDYAPEEWSVLHSAMIMKAMARTLAGRGEDAKASNTRNYIGEETYDQLFEEYNPKQSPIIPVGTSWDHITKKETENIPQAPSLSISYNDYSPDDQLKLLMGSNNWAVSSQKTKSGATILAGDPHLSLTLPSIWFEAQLHAPDHNTYGVTIAGMQGVLIGFNENIAWSETNVGHDIIDWFEIKWTDASKTSYSFNGSSQDVSYRVEKYKVKGQGIITDTIKYAVWGPIFEASDNDHSQIDLAMRWLAHDKTSVSEITTFPNLNRAKNYDEYRSALSTYITPAQNFVFASRDGDVAITVAGRLPLREDQQGRFVQVGDDYRNDWADLIPFEHNPHIKNPARGFVSSANQHSTAPDYPYYYTAGRYFEDYRGRHLNDRLEAMNDITIDDMKDLQYDSYSIKAREIVPILIDNSANTADPNKKQIIELLSAWDYRYTAEARAPVPFEMWSEYVYQLTWDEFDGSPFPIDKPEIWKTIEIMEQEPNSKWFDIKKTLNKESLNDIISIALDSTVVELNRLKKNGKNLTWNERRNTKITHLGRIPAFSRNDIKTDGNRSTLNAVTATNGPSWRMIVSFDQGNVSAEGIYPGGQSGNPASPHYDDMIDKWSKGEYYPISFLKDKSDNTGNIISINTLR